MTGIIMRRGHKIMRYMTNTSRVRFVDAGIASINNDTRIEESTGILNLSLRVCTYSALGYTCIHGEMIFNSNQ
jgi:hypothetical protein